MLSNPSFPTLHGIGEIANEEDAMHCYNCQILFDKQYSFLKTCFGNSHPFSDENVHRHYENFRINSVSAIHLVIWMTLGVTFSYGTFVSFADYDVDIFVMRAVMIVRLFVVVLALFNYYKIFTARVAPDSNREEFHLHVNSVTTLSNFIVIAAAVVNGVAYVWGSSLGSCLVFNFDTHQNELPDYDDTYYFDCNPSFEIGDTPANSMILLLVGNIFIVISLCCHSPWATRVNYFVTCVSCIAAATVSPAPFRSTLVVLSAFLLVFIYEGLENSSLAVFKALLHFESMKRIQMTELKHFIGNVAHDLKTPLHGFSMCIDHLLLDMQDNLQLGEDRESMIRTMSLCKANCSFMTAAINRTVDFTKSASNIALSAKMEATSVIDAMQWAAACVNSTQSRFCIEVPPLSTKISEFVVTDKHWLMENLLCYLSNAVKYSSDGNIAISASLCDDSCLGKEGMLCISVEDEGIGIDEDKKSSLFQPFQQTMRLAGGTGLGLYSLAKRVEVLRGKYGVTDRCDGRPGSRFWFTIPYVKDEVYSQGIAQRSPSEDSCNSDGGIGVTFSKEYSVVNSNDECGVRGCNSALIVEDSLVIAKSTKRMLSKAGYSVDVAENGAIGLEKMKMRVYTIVVMDLQMPIMDGLEATRRIRSLEKESLDICAKKNQLIIGVSANGADDVREEALASGMDFFVPKPFSVQLLMDILSSYEDSFHQELI